jgi:hypothetical protein
MGYFNKTKKQKNKKAIAVLIFVFLFSCFFVFFSSPSYAAILPTPSGAKPADCTSDNCGNYTLDDFVQLGVNVANWILGIVGSLALLFFVYGGVTWIISAGSSEKVEEGKTILKNAVIGLIIVFVSWTIINFTLISLGYDTGAFGTWYTTAQ